MNLGKLASFALSLCLLIAATVAVPSDAFADEPIDQLQEWEGQLDFFMTGVNLAKDTNGDGEPEDSNQPASFSIATTSIPSTATLENSFLYWGGSLRDGDCPGSVDDEVSLTFPDGTTSTIIADECYCSGSAGSYDIQMCRAEVTTEHQAAGGDLTGTFTVDGYTGKWTNGSTDNASASLVQVYSDTSLDPRRVVLFDGLVELYQSSTTLNLTGFDVDSTPSGDLTYYVLEAEESTTGDSVTVNGQPGPAGPTQLSDADNPANEVFNRTINTTNPVRTGVTGVDIDQYDISTGINSGDNQLDVLYDTGQDKVWVSVNVVGIDQFDPILTQQSRKDAAIFDTNGDGELNPGEVVEYTIHLENTGNEDATTDVRDSIPPEASSWTLINDGGGTDNSTPGELRLDDVSIPAGGSVDIVIEVTVGSGVSDETVLSNTATWSAPPEGGEAGSVSAPDLIIRVDTDGDGIYDNDDNCPLDANPPQDDFDGDGIGDVCDPDDDNDGVNDPSDCDPYDASVLGPDPETCDGVDNDCDGSIDEDFTDLGSSCSVGTGECSNSGSYVCTSDGSGTECSATAGSPAAESCDGLDNDCDGSTDEDFSQLGSSCSVGTGECEASGSYVCTGDGTGTTCNATAGSPSTEVCDGLDNDCDGSTDEDFTTLGDSCTEGTGACEASGTVVCSGDTLGTTCDATVGSPSSEVCDGVDNDCDGSVDEDFSNLGGSCTVGTGACEASGTYVCSTSGGGTVCDATAGGPTTEICDGIDNDCDGQVDEDFADLGDSCTEGQGVCATSGTRVCATDGSGTVCDATPPGGTTEVCDGLDNDCDGSTDETFTDLGDSCSVGTGQCAASGSVICRADELGTTCDATAGSPVAETCDGLDNDCDGTADEDFTDLGATCQVGTGECRAAGTYVCSTDGSGTTCDATAGAPTAEICDGLDNDCDGQIDEDFTNLGDSCTAGSGACQNSGNYVCATDGSGTVCDAVAGTQSPEVCDGADNDCDGQIDETFTDLGTSCSVGQGVCATSGSKVCASDGSGTVCDATPPAGTAELCDGLDNDCDGSVDEDFTTLGDSCTSGLGECETSGTTVCSGDGSGTTCDATPPSGSAELCDALDNDCDGEVDEDFTDLGDTCTVGEGACEASGAYICAADGSGAVCDGTPGDPTTEICDSIDNDCDGEVDEGFDDDNDGTPDCQEPDDDGDGDPNDTDCDPDDGKVYNGAPEYCDREDSDCDGDFVDQFEDADGDGYPECDDVDSDGDGSPDVEDCRIDDDSVYPGAEEVCDNIDQDCDGSIVDEFDDTDGDALPDCIDGDIDGDMVPNEDDNCPEVDNPNQVDSDGDGVGDACEGNGDSDAGIETDGGMVDGPDAGTGDGNNVSSGSPEGCGCNSADDGAPSLPGSALMVVFAGAAMLWRRRQR